MSASGQWRDRLAAALGQALGSPADVGRKIEARLLVFGAKPGKWKYPTLPPTEQLLEQFLEALDPTVREKTQDVSAN
jgi:hypothetical protein